MTETTNRATETSITIFPPKVDKTKPLKDQFKTLAEDAGIEVPAKLNEPDPEPEPEAASKEPDNNKDCKLDDDPPFDVGTTLELPSEMDIYKHKLAEAVIPTRLLTQFFAMFPSNTARRVKQISDANGLIKDSVRYVLVYDTWENLRKYEK